MSYYGLDLEKIENAYESKVNSANDHELAEFAKAIIPQLLDELRKTRREAVNNLLKEGATCDHFWIDITHLPDALELKEVYSCRKCGAEKVVDLSK